MTFIQKRLILARVLQRKGATKRSVPLQLLQQEDTKQKYSLEVQSTVKTEARDGSSVSLLQDP
jgi:hypothetical protein